MIIVCALAIKSLFEKMIGVKVSCDYGWDDAGIVRIGSDIAAYASVDFRNNWRLSSRGLGRVRAYFSPFLR